MDKPVSRRIFAFDFIRILAMLMIIVFHYNAFLIDYQIEAPPLLFIQYANGTMGHIGVSLFFILSGASLMYSCRKSLVLKDYLRKRFLSIYPVYWITYAAFFTHFYIINRLPMAISRKTLLLSFLGMDGYLYYKIPCYYLIGEWFVGCIVILYLIFPLLRRLVLKAPAATALICGLLYLPYVRFYPFEMEIARFFLTRVPELLFGMYLSAYFYKDTSEGIPRLTWKMGLPALAALLVVFYIKLPLSEPYIILWTGISTFLFLGWISRFFEWKWLLTPCKLLSGASFAIFLVHHVLMGPLISPEAGRTLTQLQNYGLFFRYFVFTCIAGFIFYGLSQWAIRLLYKFFSR